MLWIFFKTKQNSTKEKRICLSRNSWAGNKKSMPIRGCYVANTSYTEQIKKEIILFYIKNISQKEM